MLIQEVGTKNEIQIKTDAKTKSAPTAADSNRTKTKITPPPPHGVPQKPTEACRPRRPKGRHDDGKGREKDKKTPLTMSLQVPTLSTS